MSGWIKVEVIGTEGSVPREVGATMIVHADRIEGTIGGGSLEWSAMARARHMLTEGAKTHQERVVLGPDMGQCCGGRVTLSYAVEAQAKEYLEPPLFIWGAGHVGRAIAAVLAPLEDRQITLIDTSAERLPSPIPANVDGLAAADPLLVLPRLPKDGFHLILTYSHQLDLTLCDGLLHHGFAQCGLIGSKTKWARFRSRLKSMGHDNAKISRIQCPIGDPRLGKHPQAIAVSVAHGLLSSAGKTKEDRDQPGDARPSRS